MELNEDDDDDDVVVFCPDEAAAAAASCCMACLAYMTSGVKRGTFASWSCSHSCRELCCTRGDGDEALRLGVDKEDEEMLAKDAMVRWPCMAVPFAHADPCLDRCVLVPKNIGEGRPASMQNFSDDLGAQHSRDEAVSELDGTEAPSQAAIGIFAS